MRWFDDKETGRTLKRPGFAKMQEAIFMGEVDTVVVWRLDCLARNRREGINALGDWCEKGIRLLVC